MNPVAFNLFGLSIRWYGILIACGVLLGVFIAKYTCKLRGLDYNKFLDAAMIALIAGVIGARVYYVVFNLGYYSNHISEIIQIRNGGLAIHGGLILGFLAAFIYLRIHRLSFINYGDAAAPSIILAQAIGRWGNFFNQEAHGGPVSYEFIKHFPVFIQRGMLINGVYYNPTFLYESTWNIIVFALLIILLNKTNKEGLVLFTYIGAYSLGRFIIEGLRTDSLMLGPVRIAQAMSLIGVIIWIGYLFVTYILRKIEN